MNESFVNGFVDEIEKLALTREEYLAKRKEVGAGPTRRQLRESGGEVPPVKPTRLGRISVRRRPADAADVGGLTARGHLYRVGRGEAKTEEMPSKAQRSRFGIRKALGLTVAPKGTRAYRTPEGMKTRLGGGKVHKALEKLPIIGVKK